MSGVLEPSEVGGGFLPPTPLRPGASRRPHVQWGLKNAKVRTVGLKMENGCPAGLFLAPVSFGTILAKFPKIHRNARVVGLKMHSVPQPLRTVVLKMHSAPQTPRTVGLKIHSVLQTLRTVGLKMAQLWQSLGCGQCGLRCIPCANPRTVRLKMHTVAKTLEQCGLRYISCPNLRTVRLKMHQRLPL